MSESFDSSSGASTVILDEVPNKRQRKEGTSAPSAKQLVKDVLKFKSGGEAILKAYKETETLTDATRRQMVNILVAHMVDIHGQLPTKPIREQYAHGIVILFPSLRDPYSKKGDEHFYDAASNTGYIAWHMKTVHRKNRRGSLPLDSPRDFLDTKGLVDQYFTLLFDTETASRLLQRWDTFFRSNIIKEAKQVTSTPELSQLLLQYQQNVPKEGFSMKQSTTDLLPPPPGGQKSPKISACDAAERLLIFHKSCCSLAPQQQPASASVPPCCWTPEKQDQQLLQLFKAHFVFNLSYDCALVNFYTFLQTTMYNIDVGKMK
ncbi:uncharacterized protein LOC113649462 [Tachysurus ichikawai]